MKRSIDAPSSEPRKTRRASLIESEEKLEAKAQKKVTAAAKKAGRVVEVVNADSVFTSPAEQRQKAKEWAADQYAKSPKATTRTPAKSKAALAAVAVEEEAPKSKPVAAKPVNVRKTRKSVGPSDLPIADATPSEQSSSRMSMRTRPRRNT